MNKIIGKIFIIIGTILILVVLYLNINTSNENQKIIQTYKSTIQRTNNEAKQAKIVDGVLGVLSIPKINIEVAIKNGIEDEILDTSVGMFKESVLPGETGNFSIAGHRSYITNTFFSDLDKVEIGDKIIINSNGNEFNYIVTSTQIVEPTTLEVLNSTNKKEITLVTCTPKYIGTHRLIIKGKYIE